MLKALKFKLHLFPLLLAAFVQSVYLNIQFANFEWIGVDDLLTLTLIDQESLEGLVEAMSSGINLFPPLYFLTAYLLVEVIGLGKDILLWAHLPLLWLSLYLSYRFLKMFVNRWIASFSTVIIATIKSAFLTQVIYIRPYCLYYCATLALAIFAIRFQKDCSFKKFLFIWMGFQTLTLSHYYGLPIALLICTPLLFCNFPITRKLSYIAFLLIPTLGTYLFFLPQQLGFIFAKGTTPEATFGQIISIYKALIAPALVLFVALFFVHLCGNRKHSAIKDDLPAGQALLSLFPFFIGIILLQTFGEGMYYRYFIPCQFSICAVMVWLSVRIMPTILNRKSKTIILVVSLVSTFSWAKRNIWDEKPLNVPLYAGSMDFDHKQVLDENLPFYTNHLPTFLRILHDPIWVNQSFLLRTNKEDFTQLPRFNKAMTPASVNDLKNHKTFIYHFYFSGSHSLIDFEPENWAKKNNYQIKKLCEYPTVIRFSQNLSKEDF
jgi:hypothetical protein